ncbi:MAG TPA: type II toxin-antitoxin system VapC family toxin [Verrucomicrobiae bacterium]|nr:type II toxin-antitoxin system VapC family toxin [Verrucomicrobiae bacterium]
MIANEVYVDPSALSRLYIHQVGSREMAAWRARVRGALPVTHDGRTEVINGICRVAFLGQLDKSGMANALADLSADFAAGHLSQADILWRAALNRAAELSQTHTPKLGTRSLDVLHVACAVELKSRYFLTFDIRQQQLAAVVGLKIIRLKFDQIET